MNKHNRRRIGALASAIALLGSLASLQAHAIALGRITVQSALGEPLRAEIDMTDITAEDAASLRVGVASAESFKAAGLEYSAAVTGLDVRLQRRADGRPYLRLSSNRAINEPFVDLIVETNGASGRMTRDYTMLFDPPKLRSAAAPVDTSAPVVARAPAPAAVNADIPAASLPPPRNAVPGLVSTARPAPVTRPAAAQVRAVQAAVPGRPGLPGGKQVVVQAGDTASAIASRNRPASVSLDQMLAAMLRSNPNAFVGGNINIIKSGAVLDLPGDEAAGTLPGEAQTVIAQSKDFNAFRRKLADGAPATQAGGAERQAAGKLQASVDDRAAKPTTPDKLTLSSGAVQAKGSTPANSPVTPPAAAVAAVPPASSAASLAQGIPAATVNGASSTVPAAPDAGVAAPATAPAAEVLSPAVLAASAPAPVASAAVASVPAPVKKPAVATEPALAESGTLDEVLKSPWLLPGVAAFLLILGGLLFARYRHNKNRGHVDSSFLESRVQLDSFFGASGGQRIDTRASSMATGTSTAYTASQLDHAGDVDPVAEADVYLAYGRDQQAEEILKEAMRSHPTRVAVHAKLVEIYAKRRDTKAFDSVALEAFRMTQGAGAEWAHITKLGRELNPSNPMYRSRTDGADSPPVKAMAEDVIGATMPAPLMASTPSPLGSHAGDSDFPLDEATTPHFSSSNLGTPSAFLEELDLDLDLDIESAPAPLMGDSMRIPLSATPPDKRPSPQPSVLSEGLDFMPDTFTKPQHADPAPQAAHSGMLEFDLSSISLDLGPTTRAPPPDTDTDNGSDEDPLEIKFLLAEEFRILGDAAGARSLADEVLAKAKGPLKVKAQAFRNTLA